MFLQGGSQVIENPIIPPEVLTRMRALHGEQGDPIPPVFYEMDGCITGFDPEARTLTARFPVQARYQNPYGTMQGGMLAAAIDNAIGPLSALLAPPHVTRTLEIKYKRPVTDKDQFITVEARQGETQGLFLTFSARVFNDRGDLVALAKARHFVLP